LKGLHHAFWESLEAPDKILTFARQGPGSRIGWERHHSPGIKSFRMGGSTPVPQRYVPRRVPRFGVLFPLLACFYFEVLASSRG
jgi:hypothetical protein